MTDYATLPRHDSTSILTCCEIADIDFDGEKEILIGNSAEVSLYLSKRRVITNFVYLGNNASQTHQRKRVVFGRP